jgi:hypothetical protein
MSQRRSRPIGRDILALCWSVGRASTDHQQGRKQERNQRFCQRRCRSPRLRGRGRTVSDFMPPDLTPRIRSDDRWNRYWPTAASGRQAVTDRRSHALGLYRRCSGAIRANGGNKVPSDGFCLCQTTLVPRTWNRTTIERGHWTAWPRPRLSGNPASGCGF